MEREEIDRYLLAAAGHSIVVDAREDPDLPGLVRTITIRGGYRNALSAEVEWDAASAYVGDTEGGWGPRWKSEYEDLDALIADLEAYLGPLSGWSNFTRTPLEPRPENFDELQRSLADLLRRVQTGAVGPPPGWHRQGSTYWNHLERFGEYRPDLHLAESMEACSDDDADSDEPDATDPLAGDA